MYFEMCPEGNVCEFNHKAAPRKNELTDKKIINNQRFLKNKTAAARNNITIQYAITKGGLTRLAKNMPDDKIRASSGRGCCIAYGAIK
jgi:hypothetical protein